jgi:hypothetical protein
MLSPFDLNIWPQTYQADTFSAEIIRNSPFGVPLKKIGSLEETKDIAKLCGSKHFVETWVSLGTGDETKYDVGVDSDEKKYVVPGESNIIIAFYPQDTSGGGAVQAWFEKWIFGPLITAGIWVWNAGSDTVYVVSGGVSAAPEVLWIGVGDFLKNPANWIIDSEVRKETADDIIEAVPTDSKGGNALTAIGCTFTWFSACKDEDGKQDRGFWSYFAEEFKTETGTTTKLPDATYWGTSYHNAAAEMHKILVTMTLERPDGTTTQKHEKYITGNVEVYVDDNGDLQQKPGLGVFSIDEPGTWTIKLEPIGWGTCSNVNWEETYTIEVAKPDWWDSNTESLEEQEIESLTANINEKLKESNIPLGLTVAGLAGIIIAGVAVVTSKFMSKSDSDE